MFDKVSLSVIILPTIPYKNQFSFVTAINDAIEIDVLASHFTRRLRIKSVPSVYLLLSLT